MHKMSLYKCQSPPRNVTMIFTDNILQNIAEYPNLYKEAIQDKYGRDYDTKNAPIGEFKARFGLLYYAEC